MWCSCVPISSSDSLGLVICWLLRRCHWLFTDDWFLFFLFLFLLWACELFTVLILALACRGHRVHTGAPPSLTTTTTQGPTTGPHLFCVRKFFVFFFLLHFVFCFGTCTFTVTSFLPCLYLEEKKKTAKNSKS